MAQDLSSRAWDSVLYGMGINREEFRLADEPKTRIEEQTVSAKEGALALLWGDVAAPADKARYGGCGEGQNSINAAKWVTATTSSCMDMAENMTAGDQICVKPLHPGIRDAADICFGSIGRALDQQTPEHERRTSTRTVVTLGATRELLLEIVVERALTLGHEAAPLKLADLSSQLPVEDLDGTSGLSSFTLLELGATTYGRLSQKFTTVTYNMSSNTAIHVFTESVSMLQVGTIPSQMNEVQHKYWESTSHGDADRATVGSVRQRMIDNDEARVSNMRRLHEMDLSGNLAIYRVENRAYLAAAAGYVAVPVVLLLVLWVLNRRLNAFGTNTITENMYVCNHPGLNDCASNSRNLVERMFTPERWARETVGRLKTDTHVTVALGKGILQYRLIHEDMEEVEAYENLSTKRSAAWFMCSVKPEAEECNDDE